MYAWRKMLYIAIILFVLNIQYNTGEVTVVGIKYYCRTVFYLLVLFLSL